LKTVKKLQGRTKEEEDARELALAQDAEEKLLQREEEFLKLRRDHEKIMKMVREFRESQDTSKT
jgi:sulfur relay (sulfurtransferase) DsrC/TusE family protein